MQTVESCRKYGKSPYEVAVLHGGPGAPGMMAPVARELSAEWGVLEPLQAARTVNGQIEELKTMLMRDAELPVMLIGSSWGAMLGLLFTASYPESVRLLILIGCGALEEKYAKHITEIRLKRLDAVRREEALSLMQKLDDTDFRDRDGAFTRLGRLFTQTDAYDPLTLETEAITCQADIFLHVWEEAHRMRIDGAYIEAAKRIEVPVLAIHGDHDPHLYAGVRNPLSRVCTDFRSILLKRCGHLPWIERYAKAPFYKILHRELRSGRE